MRLSCASTCAWLYQMHASRSKTISRGNALIACLSSGVCHTSSDGGAREHRAGQLPRVHTRNEAKVLVAEVCAWAELMTA